MKQAELVAIPERRAAGEQQLASKRVALAEARAKREQAEQAETLALRRRDEAQAVHAAARAAGIGEARAAAELAAAEAELAEAEHIAASTRINEGFMQSDVTKLEEGLAALDEAALEQEIAALHETLRGEYETLVTRMIEREHVHLTLDVRQEGVTRFVDDEAIPRCAQLRHREIGMDTFAIGRLFGRMIGLRTGGGLPPAFEYRPLVDALAAHGDLVVHDVRRPK